MTSSECRELEEHLAALRAGALAGAEAERLEAHRAGCADCQAAWAADAALDVALDRELEAEALVELGAADVRLVAAIEALTAPASPPAERTSPIRASSRAADLPWGWILAVAAGLGLAATSDLRHARVHAPQPRDAWRYREVVPPRDRADEATPDPRARPRLDEESSRGLDRALLRGL